MVYWIPLRGRKAVRKAVRDRKGGQMDRTEAVVETQSDREKGGRQAAPAFLSPIETGAQ